MSFDQREFDVRLEWGQQGVALLAPISNVVIIVDVLSFSTSVEIAVGRGATIFPYAGPRNGVEAYAARVRAAVTMPVRDKRHCSLSPASLLQVKRGTRLVLPSPNGSTLSLAAKPAPVLAGCLRNAQAVARAASEYGTKIAVIAAGERWRDDYSLRPSFEDLVGAGAIIDALPGHRSPEAMSAVWAFRSARDRIGDHLRQCGSGKELIERGFATDVRLAAEVDVSEGVPLLVNDSYGLAGQKGTKQGGARARG